MHQQHESNNDVENSPSQSDKKLPQLDPRTPLRTQRKQSNPTAGVDNSPSNVKSIYDSKPFRVRNSEASPAQIQAAGINRARKK